MTALFPSTNQASVPLRSAVIVTTSLIVEKGTVRARNAVVMSTPSVPI
jgi:hypothetical protein